MKRENHYIIPESRLLLLESKIARLTELLEEKLKQTEKPALEKPKMFYTRKEFCDYFNIHISSLNRMLKDGRIRATKIGHRVCINKTEVERIEFNGIDSD